MYCIVDSKRNLLHRVTFSKSLAKLIIRDHPQYELKEANFIRTRVLKPGEKSNALYGVVATKKDLVLRVPMTKELAQIYASDSSRHIEEIYLDFK